MREELAARRPLVDDAIEEILPRTIDEEYLVEYFGEPTVTYDADAIDAALADPVWDLLDRGGKRWRAVLFFVIVEAFGEDPDRFEPYAAIPEILHNGTIIVDDVEDGATKRRGESALHHVHGTDVALNAGNAMYFLPLKVITRNPADLDPETRLAAYEMLMSELNRTHLGQGMDIYWHNQPEISVTEDEYVEMCACKTAALARIVARLAAILTGQSAADERAIARYAEDMALGFQIADDVLDVENTMGDAGDFGKAFGNDVREGKKTLMAIHAAEHAPPEAVARLEDILWADDNTDEEVLEVIDIFRDAGSIEYARQRAREFAERAQSHLDGLDLVPEQDEQLRAFAEFVVERDA